MKLLLWVQGRRPLWAIRDVGKRGDLVRLFGLFDVLQAAFGTARAGSDRPAFDAALRRAPRYAVTLNHSLLSAFLSSPEQTEVTDR